MSCRTCGHPAESVDGARVPQGHNVGCAEARVTEAVDRDRTRESECLKDGCTNPRAASKGPRPAKYCDDHRTTRSK